MSYIVKLRPASANTKQSASAEVEIDTEAEALAIAQRVIDAKDATRGSMTVEVWSREGRLVFSFTSGEAGA